ncbi:DJ-1/PfpI family protein [Streptomyces sp. LaPpAH-108]|uniref:DJ-1/PfpI family protein n=1 Tax=Streptomyces sp. LaPpAH-108 TaxID=1155714 RepID=UPI00039A70E7|nr:DJ-1/PfpI family protein [Streptomyces sp. LaPpAH-108]
MATASGELSKEPTPDPAEDNAYFPSPYSLSQYTAPKTDFAGVKHKDAYSGDKKAHHLMEAGFDIDVATVGGYPAKLELWALPEEDEAVLSAFEALKPKLKNPLDLADVVADDLGEDSKYVAVFIPGGHGAVVGLPRSEDVTRTLDWALANDKYVITLCHGPAALLAASLGKTESPFKGYSVCVFPDALDEGPNLDIGYLPGRLQWLVAGLLREQGLTVLNDKMTGQVHQDRRLLTGDSPLASNALGLLAADALVEATRDEG